MRRGFPIIHLTDAMLNQSARLLASFAAEQDSEGVVYWFGLELGNLAVVTTLVVPDADTRDGCVFTSAATNAEALTVAVNTPLVLLGQAHSHPFDFIGHSRVDDRDTFAQFPGSISVVVPFYGRSGMNLLECGVHRHTGGKYHRIGTAHIDEHIRILPGAVDFRHVPQRSESNAGTRHV